MTPEERKQKAFSMYPDIYSLKPDYEDLIRGGPTWWKLKWKPLYRKTFSFYKLSNYRAYGLGFFFYTEGVNNGWGRSYDRFDMRIIFLKWEFNFWIKWNYVVMAEGPRDMGFEYPLDIPQQKGLE